MREAGFTTTELLLTVAIIGLMAAIATPSLTPWLSSIRVNAAARDIASDFQLARMKAIAQNTRFRISFNTTTDTYQLEKDVAGVWQTVGAAKPLPKGVDLVSATVNPVFQPNGTAPGGTTVTLQNAQGRSKTIRVSFAGRVKID